MNAVYAVFCLIALNILDYTFTLWALASGATELNPLVRWLFSINIAAPLVAKLFILMVALVYAARHSQQRWFAQAMWACVFVYTMLVLYQCVMMRVLGVWHA